MTSRHSTRSSIEPLEHRIAPALLVNGANLLGGAGNPATGETSVGENAVTLVKVLSGQALVWFENGDISSISFGPNTTLEIHGDIYGDVVGNLTAAGTLSDSDNNPANGEDGAQLLANNLLGLKVLPLIGQDGSIGNVITGGSINGLSISGELLGAYAGDGVFRPESDLVSPTGHVLSSVGSLDINPVKAGTQSTFDFTAAGSSFLAGASIKTAKITRAPGLQLFAGSGNPAGGVLAGAGPAGGSISNITIESALVPSGAPTDTPSYWLIAGDGANGKTGGAGGGIDHIVEKTSYGPVVLKAGTGGVGSTTSGGFGGSISFLDLQSNSAHYIVTAGNGGDGAPAGDGGKLLYNNFSNRTPVSGIILAADFTGDDIDDILVVDAATGQMIVSTQDDSNPGDGIVEPARTEFRQLVQFENTLGNDVVLIDPNGLSPSDATAMDVDGDGLLDIVVAYKNSNSLGVFLNQGGGSFYDPNAGTSGAFATGSLGLTFSPFKIASNGPGGYILAIAENREGKGIMHYGLPSGTSADDLDLELSTGSNEFSQPVADVVYAHGEFLTAFTNGVISKLQPAGLEATKPFIVTATGVAIAGGISDLEVDSTTDRLLALSSTSRTVSVFDNSTTSLLPVATITLSPSADPLVAHFVHDADPATEDAITVLSLLPAGSVLTTYTQAAPDGDPLTVEAFGISATLNTTTALKNFVPVYSTNGLLGDAALAGSMNGFTFTPDLISTTEFPLPFASKVIEAKAGNGGDGLNIGKTIGKGGAGGSITGINADANEIRLFAGIGGKSESGPGGAGGSVTNPPSVMNASLATIVPALVADVVLQVEAGGGGTPTGPNAKTASGGAGGSLIGLNITLDAGDITLTTGNGGDGLGGAGGNGGNFNTIKTLGRDGNLTLSTGTGGKALAGTAVGGAGGSIINFSHELALAPDVELLEKPYSVSITTGWGGTSLGGIGGAGGSLQGVTLKLDGSDRTYNDASVNPPLVDALKDSTVRVSVLLGEGGAGATGGVGGSIRDFSHTSVFDQLDRKSQIRLNYVVMQLTAGNGGTGTAGAGGAGGSIQLLRPISGVTFFDPDANSLTDPANHVPFIATAGTGGGGSTKGGAGGAISGLTLQNASFIDGTSITGTHLLSAIVTAGGGGSGGTLDGGAGGAVTGALIAPLVGFLVVSAGGGGGGGTLGMGGGGGAVSSSTFGVVNTAAAVGLSVTAGNGGPGTIAGGAGGALANLQVSTPQSTNGISAILLAGDGGPANSNKGPGGKGGDVTGLNQGKDVNSSINLIEAGNGGHNPLGIAGAGGNIVGVKTVGFIGRPSDGVNRLGVFDHIGVAEIPQGLFSGRGGQGVIDGINGSVTNVTARQIAAIAAKVDGNGLFAAASKISGVKASLIGFDVLENSVFDSTVPGTPNPGLSKPIDGFVFGTSISQVIGLPTSTFIFTA
jgi:hypothetical protein